MTTQTVPLSDLLAIMKELQTHAHKRIEDPSVGPYEPSFKVRAVYQQLQALPDSRSDWTDGINSSPGINGSNGINSSPGMNSFNELNSSDDAYVQIKSISHTGATSTADTSISDINNGLTAYETQAQSDPNGAKETFKQKMEASKANAIANTKAALDRAYDKANDICSVMQIVEHVAMMEFMQNKISSGFEELSTTIANYMDGPTLNPEEMLSTLLETAVFSGNLKNLIDNNFS